MKKTDLMMRRDKIDFLRRDFNILIQDLRLTGRERGELDAIFDGIASLAEKYSKELKIYEDEKSEESYGTKGR